MATENTQQEQVQGTDNLDFSEFLGVGQQESAPAEQVTPTPQEVQQEEMVDLDGEQVPISEIDNPKSYKFFQSKFTKEQQEKQRILEDKIRLEERLKAIQEQQTPQRVNQAPQKPKPTPPMPQGFNMVDATTDPNSESGRWYETKLRSDVEWQQYNDYFISQTEHDREARSQQEQFAHQKAKAIQGFLEAGTTPEEASKVFDWVAQMVRKDDPKFYIDFYRFVNGQNSQTQQRSAQFTQQGQRQGIPLPPTVAPSKSAPQEEDFGDALLKFTKQYRI